MRTTGPGPALLLALTTCAVLLACSGDSDPSPAPETPTAEAAPEVTPTAEVALPPDNPTGPPPPSDRPCPIDVAVCDFASQLLPILRAGDIDAFLDLAEPLPGTCPQPGAGGLGGPSFELCRGAAPGERRFGYWSCSGECLLVSESEFRVALGRWFAVIPGATGSDRYATGALRVGAVSCARPPSQPSGTCDASWQRVHFTFIVPPGASGDFPSGQRTSFHVAVHVSADGRLLVDGFGVVVPPNSVLSAFSLPARGEDGQNVTLENYPWTP